MVCQSPISKKSVCFDAKVRVRAALHIDAYSEEEIRATWLNAADMHRIRGEIRYTVEMMNRGGTIDENEYSKRGLEYRTSAGIQIRREHRSAAVRAVLNEQYEQEVECFLDEKELSKVYKECVYRCQVTAQLSALSDMRVARLFDVEFDDLNAKLYPEISSFSQRTAPRRGRTLLRIFGRAA
jgi:hypothetical protein